MEITKEISLRNFEFWSGAKSNAERLTCEELDQLESVLQSFMVDKPLTETEVNDIMWFEFDKVCEWIGLEYDSQNDEIIRN